MGPGHGPDRGDLARDPARPQVVPAARERQQARGHPFPLVARHPGREALQPARDARPRAADLGGPGRHRRLHSEGLAPDYGRFGRLQDDGRALVPAGRRLQLGDRQRARGGVRGVGVQYKLPVQARARRVLVLEPEHLQQRPEAQKRLPGHLIPAAGHAEGGLERLVAGETHFFFGGGVGSRYSFRSGGGEVEKLTFFFFPSLDLDLDLKLLSPSQKQTTEIRPSTSATIF